MLLPLKSAWRPRFILKPRVVAQHRLFVQFEAPADQCPGALAGSRHLVHLVVGRGHDAVSAPTLGQIQRLVSLSKRVLKILIGMRGGHTEAGSDGQRIFWNEVHLRDFLPQLFSQLRGLFQARARTYEHELFASPATQSVGVACVRTQDLAQLAQHTITAIVAALIVDALEVIDIDDDDARRHPRSVERLDESLDAMTVQDIGQRIERRQLSILLLLALQIMDLPALLAMPATQQ